MSHTEGDWYIHREGFSTVYVECRIGGGMVQEVAACGPTEAGPEQQEANARLTSAAPDLLAALELLLGKAYKQNFNDSYPEILERVEAAISKAKGLRS